jgi:hypothetical protein
VETWTAWSADTHQVPSALRLVPANHAVLADAWVLGPARSTESITTHLSERLIGGDTLAKEDAIRLVRRLSAVLREKAHAPFEHPILSLSQAGARLETLYFDGPAELDWPAFAFADDDLYIALDRQHITRIEI